METVNIIPAGSLDLEQLTSKGHFTKAFNPDRVIPPEKINTLLNFLHSTASSVNIQPTRYYVISSTEMKVKLADSFKGGFAMNEQKVRHASHVIVCATMTAISDEYLAHIHEKEETDGRFATPAIKENWGAVVRGWIDMHRYDAKDLNHWMEKQTYLAVGTALVTAASLGIDVAPLEGFDSKETDAIFGLREKGLTTTLLLSLGYRDMEKDFAVNLPKSRLPKEEVFTFL